ncbi:MAG: hypothetical protein F6K00_00390 [Leptolyngbya sp. SIOISBB]|nr:hypothetical protein [Leptolyngbya sp. SIOISBB]
MGNKEPAKDGKLSSPDYPDRNAQSQPDALDLRHCQISDERFRQKLLNLGF